MSEMDIAQVAKIVRLKPHTLRYYENIGLIKDVRRNASGHRIYSETDITWLEFINRLRSTGMKISKMIEYTRLRNLGDETVSERKKILQDHLTAVDAEMKKLSEVRSYVAMKIDYYSEMEAKLCEQK